jgi:ComF family protein
MFPNRLEKLRAGFLLDEPMRSAVHRFKYLGEYQRGQDLGARLARRLPDLFPNPDSVHVVVPVPLHRRRFRQRGFNQATILAKSLAESMDVPLVHALRRTRNTQSQTELDIDARAANVAGAFEPVEEVAGQIVGRRVAIVDDVTTTGATMAAVATSLEAADAASVVGIALARER